MSTEISASGHQTGKIDALTGARFPAIMVIVFDHLVFLEHYGLLGDVYHRLFRNATLGVNFFFMMSGFGMMLGSLRRDPDGSAPTGGLKGGFAYAKRHVRKIYPVYFLMLLFGMLFELVGVVLEYGYTLPRQIAKCIILFSVDLTLLQSATGKMTFSHALNGVCWFLSTLFCIYIVSPFIMRFLKHHVKTVGMAIAGIAFCIFCSLALAVVFTDVEKAVPFFDDLVYGSPYRRVFYVIPGMLLAQIYTFHQQDESYRESAFVRSGGLEYLFIGLSAVWNLARPYEDAHFYFYFIDMILIIGDVYVLAVSHGKVSKLFQSRKMVYLGNISMYIFLTHYLIMAYSDMIVTVLHLESLPVGIIEAAVIIFGSILVSMHLYAVNGKVWIYDQVQRIISGMRAKKQG